MHIVQSQSTERPPEWDTQSSPVTVYHNIDIVEVPPTEDEPRRYNYTQEVYTPAEYQSKMAREAAARLDNAEAAILALMDGGLM